MTRVFFFFFFGFSLFFEVVVLQPSKRGFSQIWPKKLRNPTMDMTHKLKKTYCLNPTNSRNKILWNLMNLADFFLKKII
jgi:hypothetical protein